MDLPQPPINRLPLGLLSFFDIKAYGKSPATLQTQVAGTFDLGEFYLPQAITTVAGSVVAIASGTVGYQNSNTVPNGEAWLLINYSVRCNGLVAGDSCAFSPAAAYRDATGAFVIPDPLGPEIERTGSATLSGFLAAIDPGNRWRVFPAGSGIGVHVGRVTVAATLTFVTNVIVARLVT